MQYRFIAENDIYDIFCDNIQPPNDMEVIRYRIALEDSKANVVRSGMVDFTLSLAASVPPGFSAEDRVFYAFRSVAFKNPTSKDNDDYWGWGTTNYQELMATNTWTDGQLDFEILRKVLQFFHKYPSKTLHRHDLEISIDADRKAITDRIEALKLFGSIVQLENDPDQYKFTQQSFTNIESQQERNLIFNKFGGYFKEVPLTSAFAKPYAFVLMPFKKEDLQQRVYYEVIQPTVRNEIKLNCLRADESQKASLITDQIFSQIKRANIVIAEITSLNSNVLIEIGVALTLGKQVYIFHDANKLPPKIIPFYLSKVPYHSYTNDNELIDELKKIEKEPLS